MNAAVRKFLSEQGVTGIRYDNRIEGGGFSYVMWDRSHVHSALTGQPLASFAGEKARTADHEALAKAKGMEAAGKPREDIWRDTGWFKGVDGKWRFEIDDSTATLNETGKRRNTLEDAVSHKDFFDAYPTHKGARGLNLSTRMTYLKPESRILRGGEAVWRGGWDGVGIRDDLGPIETLSGTLHEMQHAAQDAEGFGAGSALKSDAYWKSSGEVEARAVEKRMDMTPAERRARPPWLDYDIPEADQIVNFGADEQRSAGDSRSPPGTARGVQAGEPYAAVAEG
jgi:hypothetical protein